jgi:SAM-dependent methyltransferase
MKMKLVIRIESAIWRRRYLRPIYPLIEPYFRWRRRERWNATWAVESARPASELSTIVPRELVEAVDSGWFPASSSILDIGSGRGHISAWLAERGFRVLGADLSEEATGLARRHFAHLSDRVEFRTLDMCAAPPQGARFDVLLDRGCFHVIPAALRSRYIANVASAAHGGARFLLLCKLSMVEEAHALCAPHFEVLRTHATAEPHRRSAGPMPRAEAPAAALWMIRRGTG